MIERKISNKIQLPIFNYRKNLSYLILLLGIFIFSSCKFPGTLVPSGGKYIGKYNEQDVTAQVQIKSNSKLIIAVSPTEDKPGESLNQLLKSIIFTVRLNLSGDLDIHSNSQQFSHFKFKPVSSSCFASVKSSSKQDSFLEFCWGGDTIHVFGTLSRSQNLDLQLTLSLSEEMAPLEAPARFTVSELIERAKTHNFESIIEFQRVLAAKSQAQAAYLNLFPHGNITDALSFVSLNYQIILRTIGNLAPFLLPNRWFRAAEAKDLMVAEKQAWIIMDLNGMNITESLAHSARRDSEALLRLEAQRETIEGIRDLVRVKESAGLLQLGTSDDLTSLINQIQVATVQLKGVQLKQLSALSYAAGFYNPRAITGIDPEDSTSGLPIHSVQSPIQMDLNTALQIAIVRSAELRQVSAMVQWAKDNRSERIFNWLDPAGELGSALGPSFPSYLAVSLHQIDEMLARKEQLKSMVFRKVFDTFTEINLSVQDYDLAKQSKEIQARRVLRISQNIKIGINFVMSDLVAALQSQVRADLDIVNSEYGYLIALSRLNRLLYEGPYAEGILEDKKAP